MKRVAALLAALLLCVRADADEGAWERAGDAVAVLLPAGALGTGTLKKDPEGIRQFAASFALDVGVTYGLKYTIEKERPDGSNRRSFPSAHTSVAFQSAAYLQRRYGWTYGAAAYLAASFVGYSRVRAEKHFTEDVLAGAAIGVASSWLFVTPYENVSLTPVAGREGYRFNVGVWW
jgi:membrane-associated phospholipid phosphatase